MTEPTTQPPNPDHAWIHEHLALAVAGGLAPHDQSLFDAHINACPECFDAFTDARDADRSLQRALAPLTPSAQFEETLLETLREKTMHKRFNPTIKRAGMAIAAAVALAATGVFAQYVVGHDSVTRPLNNQMLADAQSHGITLPMLFPGDRREAMMVDSSESMRSTSAANLRGIVQSMTVYGDSDGDYPATTPFNDEVYFAQFDAYPGSKEFMEKHDPASGIKSWNGSNHLKDGQNVGFADAHAEFERMPSADDKITIFSGTQNHLIALTNNASDQADKAREAAHKFAGADQPASPKASAAIGADYAFSNREKPAAAETFNGKTAATGGATIDINGISDDIAAFGLPAVDGPNSQQQKFAPNFNDALKTSSMWGKTGTQHAASVTQNSLKIADIKLASENSLYFKPNASDPNAKEAFDITDQLKKADENIKPPTFNLATIIDKDADGKPKDVPPSASTSSSIFSPTSNHFRRTQSTGNSPSAPPSPPLIPPPQPLPPPTAPAPEIAPRKVIRNGVVEFEVRSFDDAAATIAAVTAEEGGFVSSTSSDKLANGKIKGQVVVRVPPERLDRLLLKLRALGDLKTQQIGASDVTKEYTDIESELRALRAMESRLIDLIKNGKGEVKDLVVAEKQLGEYRVRIEKLEGEMRYYNNLVGMATLTIEAYEKDIQTPTAASEIENVALSIETEDVEGKYRDARKILDDSKGRIVESELKKYDADQYNARIVVDVPPDKADFVTAQLKQIGKVANYTRDRKQTTTGGTGVPTVQVEQKDTRFIVSLYNLANVQPRETTVMTIAVRDVGVSYQKVLTLVRQPIVIQHKEGEPIDLNFVPAQATGRIVTSSINGQQAQQMTADIRADIRDDEAAALLQSIRDTGEVLTTSLTESADTANTTTAKRGLQLRIVNVAAVPDRETHALRAVAANVPDAYAKLLATLQDPAGLGASVQITASQLLESDPRTVKASLAFFVRREMLPAVNKAFTDSGIDFLARNVTRSNDPNTLDSKVFFQIDELLAADALPPTRITTLILEVDNVEKALETLRATLPGTHAKELDFARAKDPASGRVSGRLIVETPAQNAMSVLMQIKDLGGIEKGNQVTGNTQSPDAPFARERIDLTLTSHDTIVKSGEGIGGTIRAALGSAAIALLWSLYFIVTGILFLGPFALIIWIITRLARRRRVHPAA